MRISAKRVDPREVERYPSQICRFVHSSGPGSYIIEAIIVGVCNGREFVRPCFAEEYVVERMFHGERKFRNEFLKKAEKEAQVRLLFFAPDVEEYVTQWVPFGALIDFKVN